MFHVPCSMESGYIALTSAIIISVVLLSITLSLGFSSFFGRFDIADSESKEMSVAYAEGCVDQAILDLSYGTYYSSVDINSDGTNDCTIKPSELDSPISGETTIKTQSFVNKAYTNLKVIIDSNDYSVKSWVECETDSYSC